MFLVEGVTIIILLFASAFFSGAETALLKLSQIKIKHWIYVGSPNAQAWRKWLTAPHELITTILVGNTLVNVFISSLLAMTFAELFFEHPQTWIQSLAGVIAFVAILIFGEIVPKIFCRHNPERVATVSLVPVSVLSKIIGAPLKSSFSLLGRVVPLFKEPPMGLATSLTLAEIRAIVLDPHSLSSVEMEHRQMMEKVLELHQRPMEEVMVPWEKVDFLKMEEALEGGDSLERFIDRWIESGRTRIPVVQGQKEVIGIIGYLYVKDILNFIAQRDKKIEPGHISKWLHPLAFLEPKQKVLEVIDIFRYGSPISCIRDLKGNLLGIVTLEDLLEEFVGEILDEYDHRVKS